MNENECNVPLSAIEGFLKVRELGVTNMLDSNTVLEYLYELEYYEAVSWLAEIRGNSVRCNTKKYAALIREVSDHLKITQEL